MKLMIQIKTTIEEAEKFFEQLSSNFLKKLVKDDRKSASQRTS